MANPLAEQLKEEMSLEDKLALIDKAMNDKKFQENFNAANGRALDTPVDPMDALLCEGCQ